MKLLLFSSDLLLFAMLSKSKMKKTIERFQPRSKHFDFHSELLKETKNILRIIALIALIEVLTRIFQVSENNFAIMQMLLNKDGD